MSKLERKIAEFRRCRGPYPYADLVLLLTWLGYRQTETGGGSRRRFMHAESRHVIRLHEPHPGKDVLPYVVREVRNVLEERGLL